MGEGELTKSRKGNGEIEQMLNPTGKPARENKFDSLCSFMGRTTKSERENGGAIS